MSLTSNLTFSVTCNQTAQGQQNSTCISDSTAEIISKLCAYCVILLGSLFGNTFITIIVYKHQDLRKTINYFIVNMAVSDLLFPLIVFPVQITQLVTESMYWHVAGMLGSIFCKLYIFTSSVSLFVSVQSLMWIAVDRFVAVVFPMKLGLISSKIRKIAIASTWIVAGAFYFPWLLSSGLAEYGKITFCSLVNIQSIFPSREAEQGYGWLYVALCFLAPLFLITILYSAIPITLKRGKNTYADTAVVVLVMFYICVIPYTLSLFINSWKSSCAHFIAIIMLYFSSVVNPSIICLSFVESYRRGLRNIVCYFCGMQGNKRAKRERISLKEMRNLPCEK